MSDKLSTYRRADAPSPEQNRLWPLYGAGFENLGRDGQPIEVSMPRCGPDELLVRHDACGLCFSDVKVLRAGQEHPRVYRNMRTDPVVLGHEVAVTVVGVGEDLREHYRVGDRFVVQPDIYKGGVGYAYGHELQGGLSQYTVLDGRVLDGDGGSYLMPLQPQTGYAEAALLEPWACVISTYRLEYRSGLKPGGTTWVIGTGMGRERSYTVGAGFDDTSHPGRLLLTDAPPEFVRWLRTRAEALGVEVVEVDDIAAPPPPSPAREQDRGGVDDIVVLGADADVIEAVSPRLAEFGILAVIADTPLSRKVEFDVGQVHYGRSLYVGGTSPDIARAYSEVPVRAELKPGGRAWFIGGGGPMGHIHVQRAIQSAGHPATIVCTDVSDLRLDDLCESFAAEAEAKDIDFICLNPTNEESYQAGMARFEESGFDNIVVLAPSAAAISDAATRLAPQGVMNVFAGIKRGTMARVDLSDVCLRGVRLIGHSGLTTEDMRLTLHQVESGSLSPNRLVAAVGSLNAAKEGLQAVQNAALSCKIVIFPGIQDLPLTAVPDLKDKLPGVYAKLRDGREWTTEAENEFLRLMLP